MANKIEESINRQVQRLISGGKSAMNQVLGKGILIQNYAYKKGDATAKKEFTCECLLRCGYCNRNCYQCKLEQAYLKALKEIDSGERLDINKVNADADTYGAVKHAYNGHVTRVINFN